MNGNTNIGQNDPFITTDEDASSITQKDKAIVSFLKAAIITDILSLGIALLSNQFAYKPEPTFLIVLLFTLVTPFLMLFGLIPYGLFSLLLKRFRNKFLYRMRIITGLSPIWGLAIFVVVINCIDGIQGEAGALSRFAGNVVSIDEVEDFRVSTHQYALKCNFETAYFRTTPRVIDRLLQLHDYEQKWPFPDDYLKTLPETYVQDELRKLIKRSIGFPPEDWPNPLDWKDIEVFEFRKEHDYSKGSKTSYYLIADKEHHHVIMQRQNMSP